MTQLWPSGITGSVVHRCMDDDEIESAPKWRPRSERDYIYDRFKAIVLGTPGTFISSDFLIHGFHACTASEYLRRMADRGLILKTARKVRVGNRGGQPPWIYRNFYATGATR